MSQVDQDDPFERHQHRLQQREEVTNYHAARAKLLGYLTNTERVNDVTPGQSNYALVREVRAFVDAVQAVRDADLGLDFKPDGTIYDASPGVSEQ